MGLKDAVERYAGRLSDADRRLLGALFADPTEAALLSATALAERASVHPAAAVRLAQKLGYEGYPGLRAELQADMLAGPNRPAERMRRQIERVGGDSVLAALVETEIAALGRLLEHVSDADLETAARRIARARRIFVFGYDHGMTLADLFARRLLRSGYDARALLRADWDLPERVADLDRRDAIVVIVFRRMPVQAERLLAHATEKGAAAVFVSDLYAAPLKTPGVVRLIAPRGRAGETQSLTVPMAICNAIVVLLSRIDDGRSIRALDRLAESRRAYGSMRPVGDYRTASHEGGRP